MPLAVTADSSFEPITRIRLRLRGRVQGVGFRGYEIADAFSAREPRGAEARISASSANYTTLRQSNQHRSRRNMTQLSGSHLCK
jgi:hypothetical protein